MSTAAMGETEEERERQKNEGAMAVSVRMWRVDQYIPMHVCSQTNLDMHVQEIQGTVG